jgi:TM2 domain-containing membrane protein YozV
LAGLWPKEGTHRGPTKNPLLATVLSVVCPGLGQYYCGRSDKAAMFVFAFVVFVGLFYWLTFPWVLLAVWAGIDAFREARRTA